MKVMELDIFNYSKSIDKTMIDEFELYGSVSIDSTDRAQLITVKLNKVVNIVNLQLTLDNIFSDKVSSINLVNDGISFLYCKVMDDENDKIESVKLSQFLTFVALLSASQLSYLIDMHGLYSKQQFYQMFLQSDSDKQDVIINKMLEMV